MTIKLFKKNQSIHWLIQKNLTWFYIHQIKRYPDSLMFGISFYYFSANLKKANLSWNNKNSFSMAEWSIYKLAISTIYIYPLNVRIVMVI